MSFVKFDPNLPNYMVVIEDVEHQSYKGYTIGDTVYTRYEHLTPICKIVGLKTYEQNGKEVFEISIQPLSGEERDVFGARKLTTCTEEVFKKYYTQLTKIRKEKLKKINLL